MSDAPPRDAIRHGYDRWAAVYDHDANPLVALEEPVVREAVGDVRGRAVLDLGCGTGRHTLWLAAHGMSRSDDARRCPRTRRQRQSATGAKS